LKVLPGVAQYRVAVTTAPAPRTFDYAPPDPVPAKPPPVTQQVRNSDPDMRKRFPVSFPVSYRRDTGDWLKTKALNVSASGLCVENLGNITEDDNLYVKLHVPIATIPIECPARVVWVMKSQNKSCMGLQLFLTSNMRESLDRWLSGI
jgi:hypothetical protein